jgi:tetratricopeptide (TPR) repeat protein
MRTLRALCQTPILETNERRSNVGEMILTKVKKALPEMTIQEAKYQEAIQFQERGLWLDAAAKLAELIPGSNEPRFYAAHGICQQRLGQWNQSIRHFEKALALCPAYCEADWRNFLATSYLQDGQTNLAIKQWRIVAAMEPTYPSHDWPIDEAKRLLTTHSSKT